MINLNDKVHEKILGKIGKTGRGRSVSEIWNDGVQLKDIVLSVLMQAENRKDAWQMVDIAYTQIQNKEGGYREYREVLKEIAQDLVDGKLVLSGWNSDGKSPETSREPTDEAFLEEAVINFVTKEIKFKFNQSSILNELKDEIIKRFIG